jgi:hypothetical protein
MRRYFTSALLGVLTLAPATFAQQGTPGNGTSLVEGWYQHFLNRQPDQSAGAFVDALQRGQAPEVVLSQLLASPEYYAKGGNTNAGFLQTIYPDVISRPPTAGEMAFWLPRLAYTNRADMAYALVTYTPQPWQSPAPGYYEPRYRGWGGPDYHYRRPGYPFWR